MTSHAMSRGRLARFVAGGFRMYFAFILLTLHTISVLVWPFGVPVTLCGCLVLVCHHPKKWKTKRTLVECGQL